MDQGGWWATRNSNSANSQSLLNRDNFSTKQFETTAHVRLNAAARRNRIRLRGTDTCRVIHCDVFQDCMHGRDLRRERHDNVLYLRQPEHSSWVNAGPPPHTHIVAAPSRSEGEIGGIEDANIAIWTSTSASRIGRKVVRRRRQIQQ
eukprot:GHVU01195598.1.p1 GENE.GHVU01195598.1~~GHVU01195598.1.p1  ORF type:complete len:147 (+),score=4.52 GHVU01195598.1:764-1204(+)